VLDPEKRHRKGVRTRVKKKKKVLTPKERRGDNLWRERIFMEKLKKNRCEKRLKSPRRHHALTTAAFLENSLFQPQKKRGETWERGCQGNQKAHEQGKRTVLV